TTDGAVLVVDLSAPSSPILADSIAINDPGAIAVSDDYTFVVDEEKRVRIIYSEDPTNLGATVWTWSRDIDGDGTPAASDIAAVDGPTWDYLYITDKTNMDPGYGTSAPDYGYVHKVQITDYSIASNPSPLTYDLYASETYKPLKVAATDTYVYIFALVPFSTGIVWHSIEVLYASTLNLAGTGALDYETASFSGSEDIFVLGSRVFTADGIGARMWDVSTPTNPISEEFWNTPGFSEGVAVGGNQLYVASNELGLQRIDLTPPPGDFQTEGTYAGTARDLAISGDTAFIATSANTIVSLDISIPGSPQLLDTLALAGPRGLAVSGNHLVVANGLSGVTIVDISDPTSMSELGSTAHIGSVVEVALLGDFAYCAGTGGLQVFNIANTANPVFIGYHDSYSGMNHVVVHGDVAYVTDSGYFEPNVFHILDVSVPGTPVEIDT
ncbi:MAG: hypothetical protein KAU31_06550, partial [Spirochaetaceae bacterium]|nr:hypothetical protein [Spirochaetaceae bacterium]